MYYKDWKDIVKKYLSGENLIFFNLLDEKQLKKIYVRYEFILFYVSSNLVGAYCEIDSDEEKFMGIFRDFKDEYIHTKIKEFREIAGILAELGYYVQDII